MYPPIPANELYTNVVRGSTCFLINTAASANPTVAPPIPYAHIVFGFPGFSNFISSSKLMVCSGAGKIASL